MSALDFRLLGELEARAAGHLLDAGQPRQQAVLSALLVDIGRPIPTATLVDRVWGEEPPDEARNVLYSHLSRIRRLLRDAAVMTDETPAQVERRPAGYVLRADPDAVDLYRFQRLVGQACEPRRADADRAAMASAALALWRGTPLAGIPGKWAEEVRDKYRQYHLRCVICWARAELQMGHFDAVIAALPDYASSYPLAEPLEAVMMQALRACGRKAEALGRYQAARLRLIDELGTEPGPELRALHHAILQGAQPALVRSQPVTPPALLPPNLPGFIGRTDELRALDALLRPPEGESGTMMICGVSGSAGVGKTALAVRWAYRVAGRYTDGQLYANLRGFDPAGPPMQAAEAIREFLEALGVPAERMPASLAGRTALYRSVLADRKALVVLDNARDAAQVRPLLPGSPGCLVVITSRDRLAGLMANEGARLITVEPFTVAESTEFLARRLGRARITNEPEAVAELTALCARLPLALAIVATRAAIHPQFRLYQLADELRDERTRLDALDATDPDSGIRIAFSWSYADLSAATARMFRLLAVHPGPDISLEAASSLLGVSRGEARVALGELTRAHLIEEASPGRFGFHDLLRVYATDQSQAHDSDDDRHTALHRLLDHYLHTGHAADLLLHPTRDPIALSPPRDGVIPQTFAGYPDALAWFEVEQSTLRAVIAQADTKGFDRHAWQLPWTIVTFLDRRCHWDALATAAQIGLEAARRQDDHNGQARAHGLLGRAHAWLGAYEQAHFHFHQALDLFDRLGDLVDQALTHRALAWVCELRGRPEQALNHAQQALNLYRAADHKDGEARAINSVGWYHALLGHHDQAVALCQKAMTLHIELDNTDGEAHTWDSLGYAHHHLGHHHRAVDSYQHAIHLFRKLGDRYYEAAVLVRLGDVHHAAGQAPAATNAWRQALTILEDLHHPDADRIRAKVDRA